MTSKHPATFAALAVAGLLCLSACNGKRAAEVTPEDTDGPTLAVLVVFDQMRGDLPIKWRPLFLKDGGFNRVADEGAWFQNCHYPYANTLTAAGHASISTGCSPDVHGVIANDWFDRKLGEEVSCVATTRYVMVPPPDDGKPGKGAWPKRLKAPTIGDALKKATGGKGKVVALTLKDRSAVLPAGDTAPDAVYWTDKDNGRFVTSTYYRDAPHDWVKEFNDARRADSWLGKEWTRGRDDVDYFRHAGPDDVAAESDVYGLGRTFPHPFRLGKKNGKRDYYDAMACSPMGNEWLLALAKRTIDAERLGKRETPDFLCVSFSSNDLVGHAFGPDSQEVLDVTLRSDVILKELMNYLDDKVGKGKWVMALTADHGICPLPEVAKSKYDAKEARRFPIKPVLEAAELMLDGLFAAKRDVPKVAGRWIESAGNNMMYLNRRALKAFGVDRADVERALAAWIAAQPGFAAAYTRAQIEGPETAPFLPSIRRSYVASESGDVTFVLKPYHLLNWDKGGTTHGTPHPYDQHVPLMVMGPGLKPGVRKEQRTTPEQAAVILAHALGIAPPAKARVVVPEGLFEAK